MKEFAALLACVLVAAMIGIPLALAQQPPAPPASQPAPKPPQPPPLPNGVSVQSDIPYAKIGPKPILLDLYSPTVAPQRPLPLVVYIFGGGWRIGNKYWCKAALPLAARGYIVASIDYRLSSEAIFPAQIEDCKGAVRFLRANAAKYMIDPKRVAAWGGSSGGHLAALLGATGGNKDLEGDVGGNLDQSSRVQAVVDFCGPADFPLFFTTMTKGASGPVTDLLGGTPDKPGVKELGVKASPVTYATRKNAPFPPFLIVHGDQDGIVPITQSQSLNRALQAAGANVTFFVAKGANHGCETPETAKIAFDFLDAHLQK